ncbi:MAG: pentapeptide repeat-containing protein [Anaerolineales bacterium]|nr:pentapeptide repeat-containing protein [Anaerolineales bacterium]
MDDVKIREISLRGEHIFGASFDACEFIKVDFREAMLSNCVFHNCTFRECDLSMVSLDNSRFTGAAFIKSKLVGINWTTANWSGGMRLPLSYCGCTLNHATYFGLNLEKWRWIDCEAVDVDFREALLREADFGGTDLRDSLFMHTQMQGADLSRARNYHIAASDNNILGAKFSLPEAMSLLEALGIVLVDDFD